MTPFYDPMIAKVIVHDRDRTSAMRRMAVLMGEAEVVGVTTNAALLQGAVLRIRRLSAARSTPASSSATGAISWPWRVRRGDRAFAVATLARLRRMA